MIKKSMSRNQRSRSAKLKHVLQILLLLCICFWLLYQIKRSYDRKRDMIENDSKALVKGNDESGGGLSLGRKDLRDKRREEEDEDGVKDEDEGSQGERDDVEVDEDEMRREIERNEERERQEGRKDNDDEEAVDNHEEEEDGREEEEDKHKMDEVEDERGGDIANVNEIAGEEGPEVESIDHEEDILDEDKGEQEERALDGGEEDEVEGREEKVAEDDKSEDKVQDEFGENSHEAREVHYRADDASSAVAQNADIGNTDLGSNKLETESNSTVSNSRELNQESLGSKGNETEATPGNQVEGKSNISEVIDIQASNATATGGTDLNGLSSNVSETVTSLPQAGNSTTPDSGNGEGSLDQATGVEISNSSIDEKTANVSSTISISNQTESTPITSYEESSKPLYASNNQTIAGSDGVARNDNKQEADDSSKASSSGDVTDNVIKMQLPDKQDGGGGEESRTQ